VIYVRRLRRPDPGRVGRLAFFVTLPASSPSDLKGGSKMSNGTSNLIFDGAKTYIEIPSDPRFSVGSGFTVSAWMRPDVLTFPNEESEGYVHWIGKGEPGQQEWVFRMYGADTTALADTHHPEKGTRAGRISFYVFNPSGGLGIGSYFQDALQVGAWIFVTGVVDPPNVTIYRDGVQRLSQRYDPQIAPQAGTAPVRIGTRDFNSYFQGAIREVRFWNRALSADEINGLYSGTVPPNNLAAEYLLTADIAKDSAGVSDGFIAYPSWVPE
jgi:concanavalin A-like lectin/glucanase superfamily protein